MTFRLLASVLAVFAAASVSLADSTLPRSPYIRITEVREWQSAGRPFLFVDTRRADEYAAGHLPGAVNIPYDEIRERRDEIPLDQPVVIYCTYSSWRAPYAGNLLADLGLDNIFVLDGGASAWNSGGQIIEASDPAAEAAIVPKPKDLKADFERLPVREYKTPIDLTLEQLREFDGKNGRPAYVAVDGVIYDLTRSRLWRAGEHDPSHGKVFAGRDMTAALHTYSPHGDKYLQYFPVVGKLLEPR